MDRRLPFLQRIEVRIHLMMCKVCARYRRQVLLLREAFRRYAARVEETELPSAAALPPDARDRIKRALNESQK
ncbi:MAG: zf-HC2 domain-containing protein [Planctomycetes bacterium]|nr:zf-HC2 domain-containing protein [Planctomycetota bacterium]